MDFVLCGLSCMTCLVYLDDIIVLGRTFEEQVVRLSVEVFDRNSCQAETSPMVRDDDDVTPELRWRRGEGV